MSLTPTVYDDVESQFKLPKVTQTVLYFFGLYDSLVNGMEPNKWIYYPILIFMQIFHISALVTLFSQPGYRDYTFSIPTFIPLVFFTIYLLVFYFPSWSKSDNVKKILKYGKLSNKFNNILILFLFLEIIFCVPLYILLIVFNPTSYWENDNPYLNFFAKTFNILLIPYGIITHTYLALLYSTLCIFTDYTCSSIIKYSEIIKTNIINTDFADELEIYQDTIENWCQTSYEIIGKPIGFLTSIVGLCIVTGIFFITFVNNNSDTLVIDAISIVIYGSVIDFILYKTSLWHSTFNGSFDSWKNNVKYLDAINSKFKNLVCFNKWLDNHESHSCRLFGKNGIKVDYNLICKLISLTCSLAAYILSKIFEDYLN